MLYMVIERFRDGDASAVYKRFRERGRMLPEGLEYVASWVESKRERCFQLMRCDDPRLFEEWTANWQDLVEFESVAVAESAEVVAAVADEL